MKNITHRVWRMPNGERKKRDGLRRRIGRHRYHRCRALTFQGHMFSRKNLLAERNELAMATVHDPIYCGTCANVRSALHPLGRASGLRAQD